MQDLDEPFEEEPVSTPKEATPPRKSFFNLLSPDDSPQNDQFAPATIMARVKKSNVDLTMSWTAETQPSCQSGLLELLWTKLLMIFPRLI